MSAHVTRVIIIALSGLWTTSKFYAFNYIEWTQSPYLFCPVRLPNPYFRLQSEANYSPQPKCTLCLRCPSWQERGRPACGHGHWPARCPNSQFYLAALRGGGEGNSGCHNFQLNHALVVAIANSIVRSYYMTVVVDIHCLFKNKCWMQSVNQMSQKPRFTSTLHDFTCPDCIFPPIPIPVP